MKWLVFGSKGWIGQKVLNLLIEKGEIVIEAKSRADNETDVENEIIQSTPNRVMALIGRTHGEAFDTIDYLEQKGKLVENIRDNLYGPLVLASVCNKYCIHFTYLGTGCIYDGYNEYTENDKPNFTGSSYSTVKGFTDQIMKLFPLSLNCRIRMPIAFDGSKRDFIEKLLRYKKICSNPNSMSVLPELLPIMIDMAEKKIVGTINLVNPGLITHNEILEIIKEIIDPNLKWENFTIEEMNKITFCARSNNSLDTTKLQNLYPNVKDIKTSVRDLVQKT